MQHYAPNAHELVFRPFVTLSLAVQARGYKEVPPYGVIESSGDHGPQVENELPGAARSTNDWRIIA